MGGGAGVDVREKGGRGRGKRKQKAKRGGAATGRGRRLIPTGINVESAEAFKGSSGGGESPSISRSSGHVLLRQAATSLTLLNIQSAPPCSLAPVFSPPAVPSTANGVMPRFQRIRGGYESSQCKARSVGSQQEVQSLQ